MDYHIEKKCSNLKNLGYLPEEITLPKSGEKVLLDFYKDSDYETIYEMLKSTTEEGLYYPIETLNKQYFEEFYLSKDIFVLRSLDYEQVLGFFYVRCTFPGRSSHICTAGFLVNKQHRLKGIGEVLYKKYLQIARDLGYEISLFSTVYASNEGSVRICRKLGFTEIGRIPKAGKMKGLGDVDALQFYFDLTTLSKSGV